MVKLTGLKHHHCQINVGTYLDMTVYINRDRFCTTLYDKRDSFSFDIVNFPHMRSNTPSKPAYGVYISQLITIGRI